MVVSIEVNGTDLQQWRERLGLTREELARELKTSYPTIYRWEMNQRDMPPYLELALETVERKLQKSDSSN